MKSKLFGMVVLLLLAAFGYVRFSTDAPQQVELPRAEGERARDPSGPGPLEGPGQHEAPSTAGIRQVVENAAIKNYGKVIYSGPVDLTKTIERIRAGVRHPHRNDGAVFGNRERLLPNQPRGYYREYVHPTDGLNGPGPQRLVVGRDGDWWYTPDHYASFIELGTESP